MKIREYLVSAAKRFPNHALNPRLEVEVLIRHVLGIDRSVFFASLENQLAQESQSQIDALVSRRLDGEPLAYIIGHREFFGLDFFVNSSVLIPRQETEILVELALEYAKASNSKKIRIADVGTGSGALAIAIAYNLPQAQVFATDIDANSLAVADINRKSHKVFDRVHLVQGDLLKSFSKRFDLIVSNPPYISHEAFKQLPYDVLREPKHALYGGEDGLDIIRRLVCQISTRIKKGGCVIIEISPEQCEAVEGVAKEFMPTSTIHFVNDLLGLPRATVIEVQK